MTLTPRAARVNSGLTQAEMAKRMGVSVDTVRRLEIDLLHARADLVVRFAEIVGVAPGDLLLSSSPSKTGERR